MSTPLLFPSSEIWGKRSWGCLPLNFPAASPQPLNCIWSMSLGTAGSQELERLLAPLLGDQTGTEKIWKAEFDSLHATALALCWACPLWGWSRAYHLWKIPSASTLIMISLFCQRTRKGKSVLCKGSKWGLPSCRRAEWIGWFGRSAMFCFTFSRLFDLNYPSPLISCSPFKSKEA